MARFNKRFEVKNETSDGVKIRPDDDKQYQQNGGQSSLEQQGIILEEAQQAGGFDDEEIESQQEDIEVEIDENGNPIIPEGWTFLIHGSSLDKWDTSLLGNDFVVGNGTADGQVIGGRPLCCVERSVAKFDYERSGSNTAKAYGGKQQAFEIRVLFYKNPRLGDGKIVRDKLNQDELKDVTKYYMYQGGRHPAVPVGTKLVFVKSGNFDEITNTSGNNILWYIPEQYLQQYLDDVQQMQETNEHDTIIADDNKAQQETEIRMATVNSKNISEFGSGTKDFPKGTHNDNIYQYTDAVQSIQSDAFCEYCEYLVANDIDMTEEGQKEFVGKAMGKEYAKLFEGADEKQLAEIFGRLDYSSLYDTQMNYAEWTNTKQKYLLGLQKVQGADGREIFVAQYEQSMEDGEPFEMVNEYYSLDEKGNLIQQEARQIQESGKSVIMTQNLIADKLGQRSQDRVENLEKIQTPSAETREEGILDRGEKESKPNFDQALLSAGFRPEAIAGLKSSIQKVAPRTLLTMDNILGRTKEQTLSRGGNKDGNEQDYR